MIQTKKRISVIAVFLVFLLSFALAAACGGKNNNGSTDDGKTPGAVDAQDIARHYVEGGVHEFAVSAGTVDLIKNGASEYKIVLPQNAVSLEKSAASELTQFIKASSGVLLSTVAENELSAGFDKIISLGATSLLAATDIVVDADLLGEGGFRIVTKGNAVFIAGAFAKGTLYGVYEFLAQHIGFEVYGAQEIDYAKNVRDLKLLSMDITDVPDIAAPLAAHGVVRADSTTMQRLRMVNDSYLIAVGGKTWHNSLQILPPATHKAAHPGWFAGSNQQLCYTAHGDEDEFDLMVETAADVLIQAFIDNPEKTAVTFTQEDYVESSWCVCPACTAEKEKYGVDSAAVVKFMNAVKAHVNEWQAASGDTRHLTIAFFAYYSTEAAPVTYDAATDTYAAIDESVICADGVVPFYAPIRADYYHDFYSQENKSVHDRLMAWSAISSGFFLWTYSANFQAYLLPFNSFNSIEGIYKIAKEVGTTLFFNQAQYSQNTATPAFTSLNIYLNSKLAWDVNRDIDALTKKFFDFYFGEASEPMTEFFNALRMHLQVIRDTAGYGGGFAFAATKTEWWPYGTMETFLRYIDEAYAKLAPLQETQPDRWQILHDNVSLEKVFPEYVVLELYRGRFASATVTARMKALKSLCERLNVTYYAEGAPIAGIWSKWQIG
jgi:hypothetical protein